MEARQKHDIGIIIQKRANVNKVDLKFISKGERVKTKADDLIAFVYPTNLEKGLAKSVDIMTGTTPQSSS